jgi:Fe-Mn family superoxide dismutase
MYSDDIPLLCIDLTEHAYFTDYGFDKKAYVEAVVNQINWEKVSDKYNMNQK